MNPHLLLLLSYVLEYRHPFQGGIWSCHLPIFLGIPLMVSKHIGLFMEFVVDFIIVAKDILTMAFSIHCLGVVHGNGIVS